VISVDPLSAIVVSSTVMPRQAGLVNPAPRAIESDMPKPWPTIIGYDGMPRNYAGVAMRAEGGRWVPVARFDPPFSDEEQARVNRAAEENYLDRCAEYAVKGAAA
jgi:hypothetical protein